MTAGKYKRTLTPTKKPTKEDFDKSKEDVEGILVLFKEYVKRNRPSLDIDKVATGETWFGEDALELGLCDELKTKDDVILDHIKEGYDCYQVEYDESGDLSGVAGLPFGSLNGGTSGLGSKLARWFGSVVKETLKEEVKGIVRGEEVRERARLEVCEAEIRRYVTVAVDKAY